MRKEEYVYKVFESIAGGYDAANSRISLGMHMRWKSIALGDMLDLVPAGGELLDLCCGTGDMTELIIKSSETFHVTGLDFSPGMLRQAEKRFSGEPRVSLIQGDAMALPFNDGSFDGAVISFALRNTADYPHVLGEMSRVVKLGAPVCCIDSFRPGSDMVRPFYDLYFSTLMPLIGGGRIHRSEYRWLSESTKQFVSPEELVELMERCGLELCRKRSFLFDSCVSVCARKR